MPEGFELIIASHPDEEHVFAELWHRGALWGIVRGDGPRLQLTLYGDFSNGSSPMDVDAVVRLLGQARDRLTP